MRKGTRTLLAVGLVGLAAVAPARAAQRAAAPPGAAERAPAHGIAALRPPCDPLDLALCLFPFPNDYFTRADPSSSTGRRVDFQLAEMPRNLAGKPIDPTEWNRQDGFSPGSVILTFVPGIDLHTTWGTESLADQRVGTPNDPRDTIADIGRSLAPDAPIVIVDAATGKRWPFWDELDRNAFTPEGQRALIIRPARNFLEGHRYVVALRRLRDRSGRIIPAGPAFALFKAGLGVPRWRQAHYDTDIFPVLQRAGVSVDESLFAAWDFTIASRRSLSARAVHIRDDSLAVLGDRRPGDGIIEGEPPRVTVTKVTELAGSARRRVEGIIAVPNYLDRDPAPPCPLDGAQYVAPVGQTPISMCQAVPGTRFYYGPDGVRDPDELPQRNPAMPTIRVPFTCTIPATASSEHPAHPFVYGHGLFGNAAESEGSSTELLRRANFMPCATYWMGFAFYDIANAALTILDPSNMASMADRAQQGFVNAVYLERAIRHPKGLALQPAFRDANGAPLFDPHALYYDGNSQGGIMGGALCALSVDLRRCVLGVPGMNYSTLLNRSLDWEPPGPYAVPFYANFPNKMEQHLLFALLQMLWDRAEADGYAHHMTADPLPGTPPHQVLLHVAFGDYQVANVAAEVEARTIGARFLDTSLPIPNEVTGAPRYWGVGPPFGLQGFERDGHGAVVPWRGSALVYWDSGNLPPPNANVPPAAVGPDPHEHPRRDARATAQKVRFYLEGVIDDVVPGGPYLACPFDRPGEVPAAPGQFRRPDWCP